MPGRGLWRAGSVLAQKMTQLVVAEPEMLRGAALVVAVGAERLLEQMALERRDRGLKVERARGVGCRLEGGRRGQRLVRDLLDHFRAGMRHREPVDLNQVVGDVAANLGANGAVRSDPFRPWSRTGRV